MYSAQEYCKLGYYQNFHYTFILHGVSSGVPTKLEPAHRFQSELESFHTFSWIQPDNPVTSLMPKSTNMHVKRGTALH